jgi:hypothetical protein
MGVAVHFPEPVGKRKLASISGLLKQLERARYVITPNEHVEVLGGAADA